MALVGLTVLCILAAVGFWVATRSWFIIWVAKPELEKRLGGEVLIAEATYQGDGLITIKDFKLLARGLKGPAAEIANIPRAQVTVRLRSLIPFVLSFSEVDVEQLTVRVSEDARNIGWMNFWALNPRWDRTSQHPTAPPPRIRLRDAAVEFGKHTDDQFELTEKRLFTGDMQPTPGAPELYNFDLREVDEHAAIVNGGIRVKGDWDASLNQWTSRIEDLDLNERIFRICPQVVQAMWERMDLQGSVRSVQASWSPNQSFVIKLEINNVDLTLPVTTGVDWARYRGGKVEATSPNPRMEFSGGEITVTANSLMLENLSGVLSSSDNQVEVVSVPYRLDLFSMKDLPKLDWTTPGGTERWIDYLLKIAPFEFKFRVDDLTMKRNDQGDAAAIDLPLVVGHVLEKFQVSDCVLSTSVDVSRTAVAKEGERITESKTTVSGQAYIHHATGRYQKFPYQLDEVDGYLRFDQDRISVEYLTGNGSGSGKIRITGEIAPPNNDAMISLHVVGTDVPVDDRLRQALHGAELRTFDMFFNKDILASMSAGGFVPDEAAIASLTAEKDGLLTQLDQAKKNTTPDQGATQSVIDEIQGKITRLQRSIDAKPFQLGGTVSLNLKVEREYGDIRHTHTGGTIGVQSIGIMYEQFPFPIRFTGGTLEWGREKIVVGGDGLMFVAPGGGAGVVTGELILPASRDLDAVRPDLSIHVTDDQVHNSLYASIPPTHEEKAEPGADYSKWPGGVLSKSAALVKSVGLSGAADYVGTINTDSPGRIKYDFNVSLKQCRAQPNADFIRSFGGKSDAWSTGVVMNGLTGDVRVDQDSIRIENVLGSGIADGQMLLNGRSNFGARPTTWEVEAELKQARLESASMPQFLRAFADDQAVNIYQDCKPVGLFDAHLNTSSRNDWLFTIRPHLLGMTWNQRPVLASFEEGHIVMKAGEIRLEDIHGRHDQGEFHLTGNVVTGQPDVDVTLRISHTGQVRSDFVQAFLPQTVMNALDGIKFNDVGPTSLNDCDLRLTQFDSGNGTKAWRTSFVGSAQTTKAEFHAGLQFNDVAGKISIDLLQAQGEPLKLDLQATADQASAMGQSLTNVQATLRASDDGQILQMPLFRGDAGNGAVSAQAWTGIGDRHDYEAQITMAGVPLNEFMLANPQSGSVEPTEAKQRGAFGEMYANISVSGDRTDSSQRRGRGVIRVVNGRLVGFPLVVQLMQVAQFTAPLGGNLDFADAKMYIIGDRVMFENITFESTMGSNALLQLSGEGEMDYNTFELNTRFRSRGGIKFISDVISSVGDALYQIELTGPLSNPSARLVPLPSATDKLGNP